MKLKWVVLNGESPFRQAYDKKHFDLVHVPKGKPNMAQLEQSSLIEKDQTIAQVPVFDPDYWLSDPKNRKELAAIVKFLKTQFASVSVFQLNNSTVEIKLKDSTGVSKFVFDKSFPQEAPKLYVSKGESIIDTSINKWDVSERSISEAFIYFFKTIRL